MTLVSSLVERPGVAPDVWRSLVRSAVKIQAPLAIILTHESDGVAVERAAALRASGWVTGVARLTGAGDDVVFNALREALADGAGRLATCVLEVCAGTAQQVVDLVEQGWHSGASVLLHLGEGAACEVLPSDPADLVEVLEAVHYAHEVSLKGSWAELLSSQMLAMYATALGERSEGVRVFERLRGSTGVVDAPSCSVVVLAEGDAEALTHCLDALTVQNMPTGAFDVIIAPIGTPGSFSEVVRRFADRLKIGVAPTSAGTDRGAAIASGANLARGDVVIVLDENNEPAPNFILEHLRHHALCAGEELMVQGHVALLPGGTVDVLSRHVTRVGQDHFAFGFLPDGADAGWGAPCPTGLSVKRSLLRRLTLSRTPAEGAELGLLASAEMTRRRAKLRVQYAARALSVVRKRLTLDEYRSRQVRLGHARAILTRAHGVSASLGPDHAYLAIRDYAGGGAQERTNLEQLTRLPLRDLRAKALGAKRPIERVDGLLTLDLIAHHASGELTDRVACEAQMTGEDLVIGCSSDNPELLDLLAALQGTSGIRCVVAHDAGADPVGGLVERVEAGLRSRGVDSDALPDVEIRMTDVSVWSHHDVHAVLGQPPEHWTPDLSVPLFGVPAADVVELLVTSATAIGSTAQRPDQKESR